MKRRLQNKRPVVKKQGSTPKRSKFYKQQILETKLDTPENESRSTSHPSNETREDFSSQEKTNADKISPLTDEDMSDDGDDFMTKINNICNKSESMASEVRHMMNMNKEMDKTNPNPDSIKIYLDLLFDTRRQEVMSCKLPDRFSVIEEKYPGMLKDTNQVGIITLDILNILQIFETKLRQRFCKSIF